MQPIDDIVAAAKANAEAELLARETEEDMDFFGHIAVPKRMDNSGSGISSPTPEGGSPASFRPIGFDDEFRVHGKVCE